MNERRFFGKVKRARRSELAPTSLSPCGRGCNGEFAAHAPCPWNGCPMQRAVRPARIEGEGATASAILNILNHLINRMENCIAILVIY